MNRKYRLFGQFAMNRILVRPNNYGSKKRSEYHNFYNVEKLKMAHTPSLSYQVLTKFKEKPSYLIIFLLNTCGKIIEHFKAAILLWLILIRKNFPHITSLLIIQEVECI